MYKYETHMHTWPVSICGKASVRENLEFYKELEYDGVFITNHFIDGNLNIDASAPYDEKINFFYSDYENACEISREIGIKVFSGLEVSLGGTDFLVYGLDKQWYLDNSEIAEMKKSEQLDFFRDNGALVIQAHPFREAGYIDHIRLFPRNIHGVEVINARRTDFENKMAAIYAENYNLIEFAGSDNHHGRLQKKLAGMCCEEAILSEKDFVEKVKDGVMRTFVLEL